jgi:hypothetical protein
MDAEKTASDNRPSIGQTVLLLVGAAVFMGGFYALYSGLGVGMPCFGLLFLLYWAAIERQDPTKFIPSVLGGAGGILLGWLLVGLPTRIGSPGVVISAVVLVAVLFCFMRGHARWVVNNATMLLLTVVTISEFKVTQNVGLMLESFLLGAAYMGAAWGAMQLVGRSRRARGAEAAKT